MRLARHAIWGVLLLIMMTVGGPAWGTAERDDHAERDKISAGPPDSEAAEPAEQNAGVSLSLKKSKSGDLEIQLDVPAAGVGVPPESQPQGHPGQPNKPDPYRETREAIVKKQAKEAAEQRGAGARAKEGHGQASSTAQEGFTAVGENIEQMHRLLDNAGNAYQRLEESTLDLGPNDKLGDF